MGLEPRRPRPADPVHLAPLVFMPIFMTLGNGLRFGVAMALYSATVATTFIGTRHPPTLAPMRSSGWRSTRTWRAQPGHGVPVGYLHEHVVPGVVAERVVHLLEAVQVDVQHRPDGVEPAGVVEGALEAVV